MASSPPASCMCSERERFTHRILVADLWLVDDRCVPDQPGDVVEGQRSKQVLVHLDATAVQGPGVEGYKKGAYLISFQEREYDLLEVEEYE